MRAKVFLAYTPFLRSVRQGLLALASFSAVTSMVAAEDLRSAFRAHALIAVKKIYSTEDPKMRGKNFYKLSLRPYGSDIDSRETRAVYFATDLNGTVFAILKIDFQNKTRQVLLPSGSATTGRWIESSEDPSKYFPAALYTASSASARGPRIEDARLPNRFKDQLIDFSDGKYGDLLKFTADGFIGTTSPQQEIQRAKNEATVRSLETAAMTTKISDQATRSVEAANANFDSRRNNLIAQHEAAKAALFSGIQGRGISGEPATSSPHSAGVEFVFSKGLKFEAPKGAGGGSAVDLVGSGRLGDWPEGDLH